MSIGLFIGRFQPFHVGHLSAIKQAYKVVDFLIIGIGSAQYSGKPNNPFTVEEREEMIRAALLENGIGEDQFKITPIPDIHNNPEWPAHVQKLTGVFEVVFVGEETLVKELFEAHTKIPVKRIKKEVDICATDIRTAIKEENNWQTHLSDSTVEYLEKTKSAH